MIPHGHLPHGSHASRFPRISLFPVEEQNLRIYSNAIQPKCGPRLFTKIMKPVVASLRSQGVHLIIYLDDILILASLIETLNRHKKLAISLLESLGFLINYDKSNLTPSQQICVLGNVSGFNVNAIHITSTEICTDSERMLPPPKHKQSNYTPSVSGPRTSRVMSPSRMVRPLNYRQLQTLQINALQRWSDYSTPVDLTSTAKADLSWWVTTQQSPQGSRTVPPIADLTISSDASK